MHLIPKCLTLPTAAQSPNMSPRASSSAEGDTSSDFLKQIEEDDDVAVAIAASLQTPQGIPRTHVQRSSLDWLPETCEDWETYNRQKVAMNEAETWSKWLSFSCRSTESLYSVVGYHLLQISVATLSVVQSWRY